MKSSAFYVCIIFIYAFIGRPIFWYIYSVTDCAYSNSTCITYWPPVKAHYGIFANENENGKVNQLDVGNKNDHHKYKTRMCI